MQTWGLLIEGNAEEGGLRDGKGRQVMEYWLGSGERPLTGHKKSTRKGGPYSPSPHLQDDQGPWGIQPGSWKRQPPHTAPLCTCHGRECSQSEAAVASER